MRIELIARNYKVSDRLEEIINKKMEKFARYFEDDAVAKITMREVKNKYAMEITIFFGGDNMVRSEVISDNMYNNIDLALPKIEGQIRKYRTKLGKKIRQAALDEASLYAAPAVPERRDSSSATRPSNSKRSTWTKPSKRWNSSITTSSSSSTTRRDSSMSSTAARMATPVSSN